MSDWRSTGTVRWGWFLLATALLVLLPLGFDTYTMTLLLIWALFALSLGFMWGYAGLLSFGHAAWFGLGAYAYAIAAVNIGESTAPLLLAILVPAALAAVLGAMMFYGRISDVYMGVITLVVTLILFNFMSATAGEAYRLGAARLGGFNGIHGFQILNVPGMPELTAAGPALYYVAVIALLGCYLLLRWILARSFGRVMVGIRENEARCELMGYNVPACKTAVFTLSAAIAGLAGCLFANWAQIVTPELLGLRQTAEVLIWVLVGGLGTLIGPVIGAAVLGAVKLYLGEQTAIDNSLVLGLVLLVVVLGFRRGLVPSLQGWWDSAARRRSRAAPLRRKLGAEGTGGRAP